MKNKISIKLITGLLLLSQNLVAQEQHELSKKRLSDCIYASRNLIKDSGQVSELSVNTEEGEDPIIQISQGTKTYWISSGQFLISESNEADPTAMQETTAISSIINNTFSNIEESFSHKMPFASEEDFKNMLDDTQKAFCTCAKNNIENLAIGVAKKAIVKNPQIYFQKIGKGKVMVTQENLTCE